MKRKTEKRMLEGRKKLQVPKTLTVMTMALGLSASAYAIPGSARMQNNTAEISSETVQPKQSTSNLYQQKKITVKGRVCDAKGEPIIGASVKEQGTTNGTITDIDGNFTLAVPADRILEVSYLGYTTQKIKAVAGRQLDIKMIEDSESLDEVVVVGYGVQKKVDLSGAVATADTKLLNNRPVVNVGQALQGSVADMNVTIGSGQATDSQSFNIRGTTSINGGSPLVVIDGVVSSAAELNRMNPSDIAQVSVLKDAASAAIYGSRAAFGVILVTTKSGNQEKLTINYNNNFAFRSLTNKPEIITDPYIIAQTRNVMSSPWYNLYPADKLEYAKKRSEDPEGTSPYYLNPDGTYSYYGTTDWFDEAYKKAAFSTAHNVDISGKSDRVTYFFSGGYNFQDGMVRYGTDKYNRYNMRSKIDFKITDNWHIGNNTSFVTSDYDAPEYLNSSYYWEVFRRNPMDCIYNPDGSYTSSGAYVLGHLKDGGRKNQKSSTLSTQFTTKIDFIKDVLWVNGSFNYTGKWNSSGGYSKPIPYFDGPDRPVQYQNTSSSAYNTRTEARTLTLDLYGTFHKKFGLHDLTAMAGYNQEDWRSDYVSMSRKDLISTTLPTVELATGDMDMGQDIGTLALRSGFGRLNYSFDNKYIVQFSARYDGTSRFPKEKRYAFNPSGSVAWVVSQEKFFEPLKSVASFLKLRFSYGSLGNQDLSGYYAYLATMGSGKISQILDGKQPTYVSAAGLVSGNLTWERVTTADWGIDLNFLNDRLSITADYYIRRTKDMLTQGADLPSVLGTSVPKENAADLKTKGWELTVNWRDNFNLAECGIRAPQEPLCRLHTAAEHNAEDQDKPSARVLLRR